MSVPTSFEKTYTVTIARSKRGNYHISQLKYAELPIEDTVQQFTPVCTTRIDQVASFVSDDVGHDFPHTWDVYTEMVVRIASCDKCRYDAVKVHWPRESV